MGLCIGSYIHAHWRFHWVSKSPLLIIVSGHWSIFYKNVCTAPAGVCTATGAL